jgi:hypothetical protein
LFPKRLPRLQKNGDDRKRKVSEYTSSQSPLNNRLPVGLGVGLAVARSNTRAAIAFRVYDLGIWV